MIFKRKTGILIHIIFDKKDEFDTKFIINIIPLLLDKFDVELYDYGD